MLGSLTITPEFAHLFNVGYMTGTNRISDFSNSLIIHEEKTKEISTVKEVWICDRFGYVKLAAPRFFNPLLSVWISDETLFLVFDILLQIVIVDAIQLLK